MDAREGAYQHNWPYAYKVSQWEGIHIHCCGWHILVVYMRLLWLKLEAADVFKSFRKAEKSLGPGYVQ